MSKPRVLITGVSGLLGSNLAYCWRDRYEICGVYHHHPVVVQGAKTQALDLTQIDDVHAAVEAFRPDIIIHAAAQANVDVCERQPDLAMNVNVDATRILADAAKKIGAKFVYISTDLVYEGVKESYLEDDDINPLNHYAKTKYQGELVAAELDDALILRVNFFGWNLQNKYSLAEWCVHHLRQRRTIKGFIDAHFSSIYTFDIAKVIAGLLDRGCTGVYNCGSSSALSKYDFLCTVAKGAGLDVSLIQPISIDDFSFSAKRSKRLVMDVSKLQRDAGVTIPSIEESIEHFVRDLPQHYAYRIGAILEDKQQYPKLDVLPYGRQSIDQDDIIAVVDTLKSSNITQGPRVGDFEQAICDLTGARYAVAVNSGTSALHMGCMAAGLSSEDEGVTSSVSFVASANCMAYCGAKPLFVDIDAKTGNMDVASLEKQITPKTKIVIPVHFAGQSADMKAIKRVVDEAAKKHGHPIMIMEDASHALGSSYDGHPVGSCAYSDMAVFSFHPVKHITTGEGGVIVTNDEALYQKLVMLRSHGITMNTDAFDDTTQGLDATTQERNPWYYEQHLLGYNYRITDIQCALGISQLKKLDSFKQRRQEIRKQYDQLLADVPHVSILEETVPASSNFHLYVVRIDFKAAGATRFDVMTRLRAAGVITQVHYIPIHTQLYYRHQYGYAWGDYPEAELYYQQCLSIPFHPVMSDDDVRRVVDLLKSCLSA